MRNAVEIMGVPSKSGPDRNPAMEGKPGGVVVTGAKTLTKTPSKYKVILHNDDYTPMDFVVMVLETFFRKDHASATKIMLEVHNKGFAVCGVYTYDVAETKVAQVTHKARAHEHPLKCTLEKA